MNPESGKEQHLQQISEGSSKFLILRSSQCEVSKCQPEQWENKGAQQCQTLTVHKGGCISLRFHIK